MPKKSKSKSKKSEIVEEVQPDEVDIDVDEQQADDSSEQPTKKSRGSKK